MILFGTIKNYSDMLCKISYVVFIAGVIILWILFSLIPEFKFLLLPFWTLFNLNTELYGTVLPISNLLIPFFIAYLFKIIRLHEQISICFNLRLNYDIKYILEPMADKIKFNNSDTKEFLKNKRKELMSKCFYKYASTYKENCRISQHNVDMAMNEQSKYWSLIEVIFEIIIALIISICFLNINSILLFGIILIAFFVLLKVVHISCVKYTKLEVEEILDNNIFLDEIKNIYNEI